jgi:hypothetical protein
MGLAGQVIETAAPNDAFARCSPTKQNSEDPMSETPVRDWIMPRLKKLVDDAIEAGFDPFTATAVITDIIASTDLAHENQIDLTPTATRIAPFDPLIESD